MNGTEKLQESSGEVQRRTCVSDDSQIGLTNSPETEEIFIENSQDTSDIREQEALETIEENLEKINIGQTTTKYSLDPIALRQRRVEKFSGLSTSSEISTASSAISSGFSNSPAAEASSSNSQINPEISISQDHKISTDTSDFECNICFDTASSPVLTLCGHLYCWSCLHQWLEAQSQNPFCPVCKGGCGKDKVIPIYGRGKEPKDPRMNSDIPNRPPGQRPQHRRDQNQPGPQFFPGSHSTGFGPHFSVSASVSLFPSLFGAEFTFPPATAPGDNVPSPQQTFLSRLFLICGCLAVFAIIFL
ncbi:hypothetical protein G9A89_017474 [Geosiphon pyriformis]|nr:hypothetical protein G9A89_017474 [Geosiphon pyriformis]